MKILLTNHHLREYTGSEIQTFVLAKYLKLKNHQITVYSKYVLDDFIKEFIDIGIPVINDINKIKTTVFDIAHVHHNICAYEVRHHFPNLPMVMWIHGVIPFLELPPFIDLNISKFLVNNKSTINYMIKNGINKKDIIVVRNLIDPQEFYEKFPINKVPKKALIISNKINKKKEKMLKKVLNNLDIKYTFIGQRFLTVPHNKLSKYINSVDLVFTVALGAMESMMCGRIPILYDYNYAPYDDGIVTSQNFDFLKEYNFSGRATKQEFTENDLVKEIKKYNYRDSNKLKTMAEKNYSAKIKILKFIKIYQNVIKKTTSTPISSKNKKILFHLINIIDTTKHYTFNTNQIETRLFQTQFDKLKKESQILENNLTKIKNSKTYRAWQNFNKIKKSLSLLIK